MKHIKMMKDLMIKSTEIKNNYTKATKVSKEEMIVKAKEKIVKYFDEVLENCPLTLVNVDFKDVEIQVFIRKDSTTDSIKKSVYSYNDTVAKKFIVVKVGYYYYAVNDEFVGGYWNSNQLLQIEELQLLKIVKHFDIIKNDVENAIMKGINNIIEKNASVVEVEEEKLKILKDFMINCTQIES